MTRFQLRESNPPKPLKRIKIAAQRVDSASAAKAGKVLLYAAQRRFGGAEQAAVQALGKGYAGDEALKVLAAHGVSTAIDVITWISRGQACDACRRDRLWFRQSALR